MRQALKYSWIGALIGLLYLGWVWAQRHSTDDASLARKKPAPASAYQGLPEGNQLKILHFYTSTRVVAKGSQSILCYGVANAKTVTVEPPVDGVGPSLNRCLWVAPKRTTTYRLRADGQDGTTASAMVTIQVE